MTPTEIIQALETLKDAFGEHDARRATLTRIQQQLAVPVVTEKIIEVDRPIEKIVEVEREKVVPAVGDRRTEPRDPGESEQRQAETLKLA